MRRSSVMAGMIAVAVIWQGRAQAQNVAPVAAKLGQFSYNVPDGWSDCSKGKANQAMICSADQKGAIVMVTHLGPGSAADIAKKVAKGKVLKEASMAVGGQPNGYIMISFEEATKHAYAVAVNTAGDGIVIALVAEESQAKAGAAAWGKLADSGVLTVAAAQGTPPTPPPTPGQAPVVLENIAANCTAPVKLDENAYELPPGGTKQLMVAPGPHKFEWQNLDGTHGEVTVDVPKISRFKGGCPAPAGEPAAKPKASTADQFRAAKSAVMFYRACWNLATGGDDFGVPKAIDRLALKAMARVPMEERDAFLPYAKGYDELVAAMERAKANDKAKHMLARIAAAVLIDQRQVPSAPKCDLGGQQADELDCTVSALAKNDRTKLILAMNEQVLAAMANVGKLPAKAFDLIAQVGK